MSGRGRNGNRWGGGSNTNAAGSLRLERCSAVELAQRASLKAAKVRFYLERIFRGSCLGAAVCRRVGEIIGMRSVQLAVRYLRR